jgi:hypothetical protein
MAEVASNLAGRSHWDGKAKPKRQSLSEGDLIRRLEKLDRQAQGRVMTTHEQRQFENAMAELKQRFPHHRKVA